MITRRAKIVAMWTCYDKKGSRFKIHYVDVNIIQTYITKEPKEKNLDRWLDERSYTIIKRMCEISCESLCDSCFCDEDSIDYTVTEKPTETGELEFVTAVPDNIIELVKHYLEKILESLEDISLFQDRIKTIEEEYKFKLEEFEPLKDLNDRIKDSLNDIKKEQQNL